MSTEEPRGLTYKDNLCAYCGYPLPVCMCKIEMRTLDEVDDGLGACPDCGEDNDACMCEGDRPHP